VLRFTAGDIRSTVLVDMIPMLVMQVPIMQIVDVIAVLDLFMPTAGAVHMIVVLMYFATHWF